MSERPTEVTALHTRLLRVTLEVESSVAFWSQADPALSHAQLATQAFEGSWFGKRSAPRTRKLVDELASRFFPFPQALAVLAGWNDMAPAVKSVVCHWHVQLTDAVYRRFSGELLTELRGPEGAVITRPLVADWIEGLAPGRWSMSTRLKFSSNLITIGAEAGLIAPSSKERTMRAPDVPDEALAYLLHLLREIDFEGTLLDNPYVRSVGLSPDSIDKALQRLGKRQDQPVEDWMAPSLSQWFEQFEHRSSKAP